MRPACTNPRSFVRAVVIAAALLCATTRPVVGQTIELTRDLQAPALPSPSLAATIISVLEREAGDLRSEAGASPDSAVSLTLVARANLRLLAADLLAAADRSGASGSGDAIRGMKLAYGRESFDQAIADRIAQGHDGATSPPDALEALASFNQGYSDHVTRGEPNTAGEAAASDWFASLMLRLTPAVGLPDGKPLQSHWIARAAGTSAATQPHASLRIAALRRRAESASLPDQARTNLAHIVDFLERGGQFAELSSRIGDYQRIVSALIDANEAIAAADWLTEPQRGAFHEQVSAAIEAFVDPQRRSQAIGSAERLDAWRRALIAASALEDDNVETKVLRSMFATLEAADQQAADQRDSVRILTQAATVLERMLDARAARTDGLTRELRIVQRDMLREYRDTEAKVLKELVDGALARGSLADPAVASLLADHRERVEDLQRLRRVPEWTAAIARIYPPSARDFEINMRKRAQQLLEPARQPEARLAMDRFAHELALFEQLPAEQSLRENRPAAASLTGGLHEPMRALIIEKRRAWADDWSHTEPTPVPSKTMLLLQRLMQSLRDAAALSEIKPHVLNRWPAWQLSEAIAEAGLSDVVTRLRLACAAATSGDFAALAEQVGRMERESPLTRVAGRLMSMLGNDLAERPDDAAGVLAQLVIAPAPDALLLDWTDDLARLCRYAAEAAAARDAGNANAARECDEYVNVLAQRLLEPKIEG